MKVRSILFVGDLNEYGRSFQRYRTLRDMGYDVEGLSYAKVPYRPGLDDDTGFLARLFWKLGFPLDATHVNRDIQKAVARKKFDLVWVDKGNTIRPRTLKYIKKILPRVRLVSCSEDDMYARHNRTQWYSLGLRYYDVVFTTKTYNLEELKRLGAKRTILLLDAYDEILHRPLHLSKEDKEKFSADLGFVGTYEEARGRSVLYLAEHGIRVTVWGNGWGPLMRANQNLIIKNKPLYGEDYVKVINATKINLCFLRKINRDEVTSRSVEIPACGGFMLAERTKRHQEFFEEGKEAAFFGSNEELLKLVQRYLDDEKERQKIAAAGRARCIRSNYSHKQQLSQAISLL